VPTHLRFSFLSQALTQSKQLSDSLYLRRSEVEVLAALGVPGVPALGVEVLFPPAARDTEVPASALAHTEMKLGAVLDVHRLPLAAPRLSLMVLQQRCTHPSLYLVELGLGRSRHGNKIPHTKKTTHPGESMDLSYTCGRHQVRNCRRAGCLLRDFGPIVQRTEKRLEILRGMHSKWMDARTPDHAREEILANLNLLYRTATTKGAKV
jgi:hypothetical protein